MSRPTTTDCGTKVELPKPVSSSNPSNNSIYTPEEHALLRSDTTVATTGNGWEAQRKNSAAIRSLVNVRLIKDLKKIQDLETLIIYAILNNHDSYLRSIFRESTLKECKIDLRPLLENNIFLHLAVEKAHLQTFEILIKNGCNPLATDRYNNYFLHQAFQKNQSSVFLSEYFAILTNFEKGNSIKTLLLQRDSRGDSAFDLVVRAGYLDSVKALKIHAVNIDYKKNLIDAIDNHHPKIFALLLNDLNKESLTNEDIKEITSHITSNKNGGPRPVMAKVFRNFLLKHKLATQEIDSLVKDVNINELSDGFHYICANYGSDYIEICLDKVKLVQGNINEYVNQISEEGKSPLFHAVDGKSYARNVTLLLEQGANPNFIGIDKDGEKIDILGLAIKNNHLNSMAEILNSPELLNEYLGTAAKRIISINNAELTKLFILNLNQTQFFAINEEDQRELLGLAIECGSLNCLSSIKDLCYLVNPDHFNKLLDNPLKSGLFPLQQAIIDGNQNMVEKIAIDVRKDQLVRNIVPQISDQYEEGSGSLSEYNGKQPDAKTKLRGGASSSKLTEDESLTYLAYAKKNSNSAEIIKYLESIKFPLSLEQSNCRLS